MIMIMYGRRRAACAPDSCQPEKYAYSAMPPLCVVGRIRYFPSIASRRCGASDPESQSRRRRRRRCDGDGRLQAGTRVAGFKSGGGLLQQTFTLGRLLMYIRTHLRSALALAPLLRRHRPLESYARASASAKAIIMWCSMKMVRWCVGEDTSPALAHHFHKSNCCTAGR